ncbi:16425_t:CDS:2 [Acaulospora morrowiae]|uniref:16425_t:CDS:1 n=1 Tax=Acaulospora morrowiae TaxID=94023 RepID=A0A9N9E807_9GLOM|nr:16425_t:CDS:2 [Acaulospora morrowiae]
MGCTSSKYTSPDLIGINPLPIKYCPSCNQQYKQRGWCQPCEAKRFKEDFPNWTSGNGELDLFIRDTQLNATAPQTFFEWIPYDKFDKIKEVGRGGFGIVYKAIWDLGPKSCWDSSKNSWIREGEKQVSLKRLHDSDKADFHFWKEIFRHFCQSKYIPRCYGFSRDPMTHEYIIVCDFIEGDLRHYLEKNARNISWEKKLGIVYNIAHGLMTIHNAGELEGTLMSWGWHMGVSQKHVVSNQFIAAENERLRSLELNNEKSFKGTDHPEAIYKSRLLLFPNLPKPRNPSNSLIYYSNDEDITYDERKNQKEAYHEELYDVSSMKTLQVVGSGEV